MKLPPHLVDETGYCYRATYELARDKALRPWHGAVRPDGYADPQSAPLRPWEGETVVCLASGPSLTAEDCERVRASGLRTIAANDTWRRAPFAHVLYALDPGWWEQHLHEITVPAERWTASVGAAQQFDLHLHFARSGALNTGARMIELAADHGAARVLLLGYDCSIENGTHWHGDHTRTGNPDARAVAGWHDHFAAVAQAAAPMQVVNCSRMTALTCFDRGALEHELCIAGNMVVK